MLIERFYFFVPLFIALVLYYSHSLMAPKLRKRKLDTTEAADYGASEKASSSRSTTEERQSSKASSADSRSSKSRVREIVVRGRVAVDPECVAKAGKARVYCEGANVYDAMLNQVNVQNNNNKYYILQLLVDNDAPHYSVWFRWGRVGYSGQNSLIECGTDLEKAKNIFCNKFEDKTNNEWGNRMAFKKVPGKYDLIEIDYGPKENENENIPERKCTPVPDSKLDEQIQELLRLICNLQDMEESVKQMSYDVEKAPLGRLTVAQIDAGYAALKRIETCINHDDFGPKMVDACNEFYTRIPHALGMQRPPLIRDKAVLMEKMRLLEALSDIEVTIRTLRTETRKNINPLDKHYAAMKCSIRPLNKDCEEFKLIEEYLQSTHAPTHNQYRMHIRNVFSLSKQSDNFKDVGNNTLLWHGSRVSNWYGILSQGLRIAPPGAPVTGYMFGKGIYFADIASKSANYCFATKTKPRGVLLLSEVSLGRSRELIAADYNANKLPPGYNSVKGLGKWVPDPSCSKTLNDSVLPCGKCIPVHTEKTTQYTLNYNEYVVYAIDQVKMRYLVEVDFEFL